MQKDYYYNWKSILSTGLLYPMVYFKSKKAFNSYKTFCWDYQRSGIDDEGVELNTLDYYKKNIKDWNLLPTKFTKKMIHEYDLITEKGTISCLNILNPNSNKWVIGLHGWTEDKYLALRLVEHFYQAGYNVITFDSFAHGRTYGQKTDIGYSTMEILDHIIADLKVHHQVDSLGLIGNSMGASTAIFYSQVGQWKDELSWVIEDSGFYNLKILYRYYLQNSWSHEKWWIVANNITKKFTKATGIDHNKYDLLTKMDQNKKTPIFFIHAQGDSWIPFWMSQEMFRLKTENESSKISEAWFPAGSSHVHIIKDYHDDYVTKTLAFAKKSEELIHD